MISKIFNFVVLQVGWFACVLGVAKGYTWLGPLFVLLFLVGHLAWVSTHWRREMLFILAVGGLGAVADSLQKMYGVLTYLDDFLRLDWLAPMWIISLWVLFATSFGTSLKWMQGRYVIGALFGFIGGPMSYLAGVKCGALSFKYDPTFSMLVLGLVWGSLMPLLLWMTQIFGLTAVESNGILLHQPEKAASPGN
ncbi:MAG: DUF2878 domain-containing protein [Blastocatellia bacterium]|nr:DUF2878 domain-containing protein [Blastocatellia bacterium]